jgi:hypothetical protein
MPPTRWTFGVEPLPQTVTVAGLLRRIADLVVSLEDEDDEVERLITSLRTAEAPRTPGPASASSPDRRTVGSTSTMPATSPPSTPASRSTRSRSTATGLRGP